MIVRQLLSAAVLAGGCAIAFPPAALAADDGVTYEVTSNDPTITTANIQYWDGTADQPADNSTLPWKTDATVGDLSNGAKAAHNAHLHADWKASAGTGKIVTIKITYKDKVLCESTTDAGEATCDYANIFAQKQQMQASGQ